MWGCKFGYKQLNQTMPSQSKICIARLSCFNERENGGRVSIVGIVTRYRLNGPEIESWWGQDFLSPPDRPWGPTSLLYNGYWVFPRGQSGWDVVLNPTRIFSTEVLNWVELYLYLP